MLGFKKSLIASSSAFLFIAAIFYSSASISKAANGEVSLVVPPERLSPGKEFNIEVKAKGIMDIHGASFELNFDNSLIEIQDMVPGTLYSGLSKETNYRYYSSLDNASQGKVSAAAVLTGSDNGISAEGSLFILKAKALKAGELSLKPNINYTIKLANNNKAVENKITGFTAREASLNIINHTEIAVKERLEDTDPRIIFSGTWYNHWEARNSGSSAKFTNANGSSFSFSFEGTGFRWHGLANKFKGKARITVDGNSETVDTYSAAEEYQKLFYEKLGLANTKHDVKIEVLTDYINIDYVEILTVKGTPVPSPTAAPELTPSPAATPTAAPTPVPSNTPAATPKPSPSPSPTASPTPAPAQDNPGSSAPAAVIKKLEQTDRSIHYSGSWLHHWENRNSGGSAKFTSTRGSYFQFSFEGTGFKWYGLANKFKGKAKITIDGRTEIINTYSALEQYRKLFYSKEGLTNGKHTVKIETYTNYINVDFIEIIQKQQSGTTSPGSPVSQPLTGKWTRFEENSKGLKYSGTWLIHRYKSNSGGAAKFTASRNAGAEFTFTGTGLRWYGTANKFKGPVIVTIDGKSERINTYFSGQQYHKLFFEKKGLNYGTHKVKLTLVYDNISIDSFEIENGKIN